MVAAGELLLLAYLLYVSRVEDFVGQESVLMFKYEIILRHF